LGNCVFIFGGKWIVQKLNANQSLMNWIIGGIFAITAIVFLIKILLNKDAAEQLEDMSVKE
ncbi:MAG TPA: lysine transporter LysE, partial [Hanamia sp.]|nr:lysine transporter LysE [Hanamia sp.]